MDFLLTCAASGCQSQINQRDDPSHQTDQTTENTDLDPWMKLFVLPGCLINIIFCRQLRIDPDDQCHIICRPEHLISAAKEVVCHAVNVSAKFFVHKIIDQVISHGLRLHQHSFHVKLLSFLRVRLICVPRLTNPVPIAEIAITALKLIGVLQITPVLL